MNTPIRYIFLVLGTIVCIFSLFRFRTDSTRWKLTLHYILSLTHHEYSRATSLTNFVSHWSNDDRSALLELPLTTGYKEHIPPPATPQRRANASFVILARNSDIDGTVRSIRDIEDRFNRRYNYPYVLLNEVPFTEDFKK